MALQRRDDVLARTRNVRVGLDVACLIDTTGTMSVPLNVIRLHIGEIAAEVAAEVPRARLGIVCYKDHGDEGERSHYLTRVQPLSRSPDELRDFLDSPLIGAGYGGGGAEAVECALHAANELSWRPWARRAIVLVGDKPPHGGGMDGFDRCPRGIDYRVEVEALARKGIRIYSVLVGEHIETRRVFEWMADMTGGRGLELRSAKDLGPLLVSICLAESGRDVTHFATKLAAEGRLTDDSRAFLTALTRERPE